MTPTAFALPASRSAKADPHLIADDERRFAAIAAHLDTTVAALSARRDALRRQPGGSGQAVLERDLEIHRVSARLRTLSRYGPDLALGRIVRTGDPEPEYIGRFGLTDGDGRQLLIDWRSPAAEPFFAATHAHPLGLHSRRRYRWLGGRVDDYWDEVFGAEDAEARHAALDEESAFLAGLGAARTPRMRDVLSTLQADQDAIIRAPSDGALVVDGGPGTGKTVVALHRAAYLLYADPRLAPGRGGVLFVGPHEPYLAYVADVLPSLGEDGVLTCTVRDLVPEGAYAREESDPEVSRLKASATLVRAVEAAVRVFEEPPGTALVVDTPAAQVVLTPTDWADAFAAAEPGTPHNEAREQVWDALVETVLARVETDEVPERMLRRFLARDEQLVRVFSRAWPLLDPGFVVSSLWSVPALLRRCAPELGAAELELLRRTDPEAWTADDLPLLDAARRRLGDPDAAARRRRRAAEVAAERDERSRVVDDLIAADDSDLKLMTMLRGEDAQYSLSGREDEEPLEHRDTLAGPFAHVVVDEAQELTDAQWLMLLARCPSRSFTIVGDRAQARHGFSESWTQRLARIGLTRVREERLRINYRTPAEIMAEAETAIRSAVPDAVIPVSVRRSGIPVRRAAVAERDRIVREWLGEHPEGTACVIGDATFPDSVRVRSLRAEAVKGLEFDLVIVVAPETWPAGVTGAVDRYVAMARATRELVILSDTGTGAARAEPARASG
ncbi:MULTISPECIES: RNA polymerase recycling motor ATPase HelR [Microbacterium]|uniref:RNA polymerase recycling motor ATPase HelR n=1 Tax=Microbacterium TaxID=33882 RepID=UPI00197BCDE3|nr:MULTISPECIES: RNA polymerase recycling motor ATPase HelR [Microbacterium]MCK6066907.1 AAA family ATPase [Microbacterium sp. EYE_512]